MDNPHNPLSAAEREALYWRFRDASYGGDGGTVWQPTTPRQAFIVRRVALLRPPRYAADGLLLPKSLHDLNEWTWRYRVSNHLNKFPRTELRAAVERLHATLTAWLPDVPEWRYVDERLLLDALLPLALSCLRLDSRRVVCFMSDVTLVRCATGERPGWALAISDEGLTSQPPKGVINLWEPDHPKGAA